MEKEHICKLKFLKGIGMYVCLVCKRPDVHNRENHILRRIKSPKAVVWLNMGR